MQNETLIWQTTGNAPSIIVLIIDSLSLKNKLGWSKMPSANFFFMNSFIKTFTSAHGRRCRLQDALEVFSCLRKFLLMKKFINKFLKMSSPLLLFNGTRLIWHIKTALYQQMKQFLMITWTIIFRIHFRPRNAFQEYTVAPKLNDTGLVWV